MFFQLDKLPKSELLSLWASAAYLGDILALRHMAAAGSMPIDLVDQRGRSPAHWAAMGGQPESLLFCLGGWSSRGDVYGRTELHYLAKVTDIGEGLAATAQLMLPQGVNPLAKDLNGLMPMHLTNDSGFWAWSSALAWSRGQQNDLVEIMGVPIEFLDCALPSGLVEWAQNNVKSVAVPYGSLDVGLAELMAKDMLDTDQKLQNEFKEDLYLQNCIVSGLGIEYFSKKILNEEKMMGSEDKALSEFLNAFDERKRKEAGRQQMEVIAVERKRKMLGPLKVFLQKFVDLGLVVPDSGIGTPGVAPNAKASFSFFESESSPTWSPGVSLFFDHPAEVEIAIPNDADRAKQGLVVIRSITSHKDKNILSQKFDTIEQAKEALAKFLGKNALSIERDPRSRRVSAKVDDSILKGAPSAPPSEE